MDSPNLGNLITDGDRRRDAIHIAVAPVTALTRLEPGDDVGFIPSTQTEQVGRTEDEFSVGIVDPFLPITVEPGQRFWLFLYPGTVTSLRHVWTHPAFKAKLPTTKED